MLFECYADVVDTYAELKNIRLKDSGSNATSYKITVLEEVIRWGRNNCIESRQEGYAFSDDCRSDQANKL